MEGFEGSKGKIQSPDGRRFVQQCNKNPDLKVTVRLLDGTTIIMTAYKPEKPTIDQVLNDITVEDW